MDIKKRGNMDKFDGINKLAELQVTPEEKKVLAEASLSLGPKELDELFKKTILSDEKLNKFNEIITNNVMSYLKDAKPNSLGMTLHILTINKEMKLGLAVIPVQGVPETSDQRREMFAMIGEAFAGFNVGEPIAVNYFTEVWAAETDNDKLGTDEYIPPSQDPNRIEMIVGACVTADGRCSSSLSSIERGPNNEILVRDTQIACYDPDNAEGNSKDNLVPNFFIGYTTKELLSILKPLAPSRYDPCPIPVDDSIADQLLSSWDKTTTAK